MSTLSHTYDANGNRTEGSYRTGAGNRVLFDGTYHYSYDPEGNRTSKYTLDGNGEPTGITTYTWDGHNRLVSAATPSGTVTYQYDGLDRMISRTVTGASTGNGTEYYVYDGANVVLVLAGDGSVVERELTGPAVDQVFASESGGGSVSWLLTDNQGSVRDVAVYNAQSATTTIVDHLLYDGFGGIASPSHSSAQPRSDRGQAYTFNFSKLKV
jgi:YD repeat-containing protein